MRLFLIREIWHRRPCPSRYYCWSKKKSHISSSSGHHIDNVLVSTISKHFTCKFSDLYCNLNSLILIFFSFVRFKVCNFLWMPCLSVNIFNFFLCSDTGSLESCKNVWKWARNVRWKKKSNLWPILYWSHTVMVYNLTSFLKSIWNWKHSHFHTSISII